MRHNYRSYPQPYRPSLRARWSARFSDVFSEVHGSFWVWFFEELNWRAIDRWIMRAIGFLLTCCALYLALMVIYEIAVIVAIEHGVWPAW